MTLPRPTHSSRRRKVSVVPGTDIQALRFTLQDSSYRRDDADLADATTLASLGAKAGLDPVPLLDAALSPESRAVYEANAEEAIRRSVFGSPTYFVHGDMFYGQDRLELVERTLKQPFAGTWPSSG